MTGFEEIVHAAETMEAIHHCINHLLPYHPELYQALLQAQKMHGVCSIHTSEKFAPKESIVNSILSHTLYSYRDSWLDMPVFEPDKFKKDAFNLTHDIIQRPTLKKLRTPLIFEKIVTGKY